MSLSSAAKTRTALTVAAGAAAAVTAQHAGAAVIYTPASAPVNAANPTLDIDFNNDGTADVGIKYDSAAGVALTSPSSNKVASYVSSTPGTVRALAAGEVVYNSSALNTLGYFDYTATMPTYVPADGALNDGVGAGEFTAAAGELYIGVQFGTFASGPYYAWVGFRTDDESSPENLSGTVTGFAYENTPGMPINAGAIPEPSSLGLLAMGATGLAAYRRRGR